MFFIFYISIAIILYVYLGYPLLLMVLTGLQQKKVDKSDILPSVALIISSYNEENVIEQKILNSLNLDYPKELLEIVVASEATDRTNEIISRYKNAGIKLFSFDNREGKAATLYKVVPMTEGDIVVFSDANAIYDRQSIRKLVRNFHDKSVGCVSGRLQYSNPHQVTSGKGELTYWFYENFLRKVSSGAVAGSIFAMRREAYCPLSKYRGDDFELAINAAINGYRITYDEEAVSFEEVSETTGHEFKRKVRIASWNLESAFMLLMQALRAKRLFIAFKICSHRILRWLIPLFLIALFVSNLILYLGQYDSFNVTLVFYSQCAMYALALICYICDRFFGLKLSGGIWIPYYFCMVNYAALVGICKILFRKTEILWEVKR